MRRIALVSLALLATVGTFEIPTAQAQVSSGRNPWCLRDGPAGGYGSWDCSYQTFQQCEATRFGAGGSCSQNPNYRGRQTRGPRQERGDGGTWGRGSGRW